MSEFPTTLIPPGSQTPSRLRVAVNAVSLAPGGGMVVIAALAAALKRVDPQIEPTFFYSRPQVGAAMRQARPDSTVEPFAEGHISAHHFLKQQIHLGPMLEKRGFDVILATNTLVGRCRIPQVVHHQNLLRFTGERLGSRLAKREFADAIRDAAAHRAMKNAAINTFISRYLKETAERIVSGSESRNFVVPNGVSQELLDAPFDDSHEPAASVHLVAIQGADVHKDNPTLIRAFAEVVQRRPDVAWELSIAGGGDMTPIKNLCQQLGVGSRVNFLGYVSHDQLDPLIRRSFCLVFTSVLEGFGIPPLEAMARGCPVIASNSTAIPEVVGDAGILVPPGDALAFADAVLRLHSNPAARSDFRRRGRARAREFSWDHSAAEMAKLLRKAGRHRESIRIGTNPHEFGDDKYSD